MFISSNDLIKEPDFSYKYSRIRVTLEPIFHRGANQILITFPKEVRIISILKSIGCRFTATYSGWYIFNNKQNLNLLFENLKGIAWLDMHKLKIAKTQEKLNNEKVKIKIDLNDVAKLLVHEYKNTLIARGYSVSTRSTYINMVEVFLSYYNQISPKDIVNDQVNAFLTDYVVDFGYSKSYQRQMISALKSFYSDRFDIKLDLDKLPTVQKEKKLPKVLSISEVKRIIESANNLKHRAILVLIYGCGLRVSELVSLKIENVNSERKVLEIINAKGFKDRITPISDKILMVLRDYYRAYRPKKYLFEGQSEGTCYSTKSVNSILKNSAKKAGIKKNVHAHMLRHSYATHLLETGVDIRYIQVLLGHKSSKTTEIYTYVSNEGIERIPNPFDKLGL